MAVSDRDQAGIREYLLGHLDSVELEKLEERLMIEDDLSEELEISKGELTEEYRAGELTQKESHWFGTHYLVTSEGRYEHELTLALECLERLSPVPERLTLGEKLKLLFKTRPWMLATASAVVLFVVVGVLLLIRPPKGVVTIALANTTLTRNSENNGPLPEIVRLTPNTGEVRASLKLPKPFPSGTRFEAVLDNQIDRKPMRVVEQTEDVVTVSMPATELPKGEYALELTAIKSDGQRDEVPGHYRFSVR